jgi:hypothetical protein
VPRVTAGARAAAHTRRMRRSLPLFALLGLAVLPGCDARQVVQPTAAITITVEPNPVVIRLACLATTPPPDICLASLDPTITITETGGVGGRVESIEVGIRNLGTGVDEQRITLGSDWLRAQAGTDRIEANGRIAVRPVVSGYPVRRTAASSLAFTISVRFVDDRGNVVTQSVQVGGA